MHFDQVCVSGSGGELRFVILCKGVEHDLDVLFSRDASMRDMAWRSPELQIPHTITLEVLDDGARSVRDALSIIDEIVDVVVEDLEE